MKTAIVIGASGLIGSHVTGLLLADPRYAKVRVLVRRSLGKQHPKLEEQVIDFQRINDYPGLFTGDELFCCLGTTLKQAGSAQARRKVDRDLVIAVARAAEGKSRRFLVVSSVGADARSPNSYTRDKGEMEQAVAALKFDSVIILQPSFFYGDRKENRLGERIGVALAKFLNPVLGKYKALSADTVARAMVSFANQPIQGTQRKGVEDMLAAVK